MIMGFLIYIPFLIVKFKRELSLENSNPTIVFQQVSSLCFTFPVKDLPVLSFSDLRDKDIFMHRRMCRCVFTSRVYADKANQVLSFPVQWMIVVKRECRREQE